MAKIFTRLGIALILIALALTVFNIWDAHRAEKKSEHILYQISEQYDKLANELDKEFCMEHSDISMPEIEIDGERYIGVIQIPALGIQLPVAGETNEELLRLSPCRYKGSAYSKDLIIAGHNYSSHFSGIKTLQPGEEIIFTDAAGNMFTYQVMGIEEVKGTDVEKMIEGQWDLTLFTCTLSGQSRLAIRAFMVD